MEYIDKREIRVNANTEDEARAKMDIGEFDSEDTIDFFAHNLVKELHKETDT